MKSMIQKIIDRRIKSFQIDADGICIEFVDEIKVIVYNRVRINIEGSHDFTEIVNAQVIEVNEGSEKIVIKTDVDIVIVIDLSDNAYSGPEAMQMIVPDGPIVVWN